MRGVDRTRRIERGRVALLTLVLAGGCGPGAPASTATAGPESTPVPRAADPLAAPAEPPVAWRLAAGLDHACALRPDGTVLCWGSSDGGLGDGEHFVSTRPVVVKGLTDAVEIAAGEHTTCARRANGTVACWGEGWAGQVGDGTFEDRDVPTDVVGVAGAVDIAVGSAFGCAVLHGGAVHCWGAAPDRTFAVRTIPTTRPDVDPRAARVAAIMDDAVEVAAGFNRACARRRGGTVTCWGGRDYMGAPLLGAHAPEPAIEDAVALSGRLHHFCAVRRTGGVTCWGRTFDGHAVEGTAGAVAVTVGNRHSCAVTGAGIGLCWGGTEHGELGVVSPAIYRAAGPVDGLGPVEEVAAGDSHTCARLRSPAGGAPPILCWGMDDAGELGTGRRAWWTERHAALPVPALAGARDLFATEYGACGALPGRTVCWGGPDAPRMPEDLDAGRGGVDDHRALGCLLGGGPRVECRWLGPRFVGAAWSTSSGGVREVATDGYVDRCLVRSSGAFACTDVLDESLVPVPGLGAAVGLAMSSGHTCAVERGGTLACWGFGESGQLGTDVDGRRETPAAVPGLSGVVEVAAGDRHTCARRSDGTVWCFGSNDAGQCGVGGDADTITTPTAVPGVTGAVEIAAGDEHTCARLRGGRVLCWGSNYAGQLGAGLDAFDHVPPSPMTGVAAAVGLALGDDATCVRLASGAVRCAGAIGKPGKVELRPVAVVAP